MHLVPPPQINKFQLLLGLTAAIEDNSYAKCSKVKKVHNGLCEKGEWPHTITTKKQTKKPHTHKRFIPSSKVLMRDCESYILY